MKTKSRREVDITYSINFDAIECDSPIVKRLTNYDKRLLLATGALLHAGNAIFTRSQLYQAMGYRGKPGKSDRNRINNSLAKMEARIFIDNWQGFLVNWQDILDDLQDILDDWQDIDADCKYMYDGPLLPFERLPPENAEILIDGSGRLANGYIHLFREPPLLTFARERNQVTTIDIKLLQTPLSKTEQNLAIEDYCIEHIMQCKRGDNKILLSTLYKQCNITTPMQISRTSAKIERLFDYYKQCGEIKRYSLTKEAIIFEPSKPTLPIHC